MKTLTICLAIFYFSWLLVRPSLGDLLYSEVEHMKHHLQGVVNTTGMSLFELRFLYFRTHDLDGDTRLDGCELVKSLYDHVAGADYAGDRVVLTDAEISYYVDEVLETDDANDDGFISFPEYVKSQNHRLTTSTGNSILGRS